MGSWRADPEETTYRTVAGGTGVPSCAGRSASVSAPSSSSSSSSTWRSPCVASHRSQVGDLAHVNVACLALGVLLEIAALAAYTQLTHSVLPPGGPRRFRLFRINLSTLALSHVSPGGTAPGAALGYRLLTQSEVTGADAGLRPRHPGDRLGGRAQRDLLVLPGRLPGRPRLPRPVRAPRAPVRVGVDPGDGGRRRRGGPARRLRRALHPAHPGPGAGQPDHPAGVGQASASSTPIGSPRWSSASPSGSPS